MGRDEHKTSRGKRHLAQTPKQQISDGVDFEFSGEIIEKNAIETEHYDETKKRPKKK